MGEAMRDFDRYRPAIAIFHLGCLAMALSFGTVVWRGGSPVTPELYGPRVYAIPALMWASVQIAGSGLGSVGAIIGGRAGAMICMVGSAVSGLMYCTLAALALDAIHGTLVASGSMFLTAPISIISAIISARYLLRRPEWTAANM